MTFKIMGIDKDETNVIEIHRGGHTRVLLEFLPCALHFFGIMDIINCQYTLCLQAIQQEVCIAFCCLVGMIGIHISYIYARGHAI